MAKSTNFHRRKKLSPKTKAPRSNSLLFLILLGKTVTGVLLSPLKKGFKLALILISLWLGIGALVFGTSFLLHSQAVEANKAERMRLSESLGAWKQVLSEHPTSREALLGAYANSKALGNDEEAALYRDQLKRIDPNDERVKAL